MTVGSSEKVTNLKDIAEVKVPGFDDWLKMPKESKRDEDAIAS